MGTTRKHRWAFWTAIAALPATPIVAYYGASAHSRLVGAAMLVSILAYFIALAVILRSALIAWTIVGTVLDSGAWYPFGTMFWSGIVAGLIWDLLIMSKKHAAIAIESDVNAPVPNSDAPSESN